MKELPHAIDSEAFVLGAILNDGDLLIDVVELLPQNRMFHNAKYRHIYAAVLSLYAQNSPVDRETVLCQLEKDKTLDAVGRSLLVDLFENTVAVKETTMYHAAMVAQKYTERELYLAAGQIQDRVISGETEGIVAWAGELIHDAGRVEPPTPPLWQQINETLALDERATKGSTGAFSWGISNLDYFTGGLRLGRTTVLAALKKAGKSKFLIRTISELLSRDVPVLFFSLEMRAATVLNWLVAYRERIDSARFGTDRLTPDELERASTCLAAVAGQDKLVILDRSFPTLDEIASQIRRNIKRHGIKVVVLDFIQRVNVQQQRGQSRADALQGFAYRLADLARDYDVALLYAAQLSNEAERTSSPHMGLIKESGGIAESADLILFLDNKRRTEHKTSLDDRGETDIDLIVEGQRNGISGIRIPMKAHLQFGQFTEASPSTQLAGSLTRKEIAYAQN